MKVTFLGTGTPYPDPLRYPSSSVIHTPLGPWLLDCGDGATWQLMRAGIPLEGITRLIFTHLHSDHTLGYAQFAMGGYSMGRSELHVWGPSRTRRMHQMCAEFYTGDGGAANGLTDVVVTEYGAGTLFASPEMNIEALPVYHSTETYAVRFRAEGQSIVHSADTAYCEPLIEFSRGADILIHTAMLVAAYRNRVGNRWDELHEIMATPAEAGRVAQRARVKKLVLVHFPADTDSDAVSAECATEFDGEIIVGEDLLTVVC